MAHGYQFTWHNDSNWSTHDFMFMIISGHAVSMINTDQYQSMPHQICGIDTNADQLIDIDLHRSALIIIEPHFGSITEFWSGIDRYWSTLIIETAGPVIC